MRFSLLYGCKYHVAVISNIQRSHPSLIGEGLPSGDVPNSKTQPRNIIPANHGIEQLSLRCRIVGRPQWRLQTWEGKAASTCKQTSSNDEHSTATINANPPCAFHCQILFLLLLIPNQDTFSASIKQYEGHALQPLDHTTPTRDVDMCLEHCEVGC